MDELGPFIRDRIEFVADAITPKSKIYDALDRYLDGDKPPSKKRVAAALRLYAEKQGADFSTESYDTETKARAFKGLKLKDAA